MDETRRLLSLKERYLQLEVETQLGDKYLFPDVDQREFMLRIGTDIRAFTSFTVVNRSSATLVLPVRIIRYLRLDGVTVYERQE